MQFRSIRQLIKPIQVWIINAIRNKVISRAFAVIDRQTEYKSVDQLQKWKQEKQAD